MPRRVLILCNALEVGGAERAIAQLAVGLRDRGFDPVVATLRARGRFFEEVRAAGIPSVFVDMRSRWDVRGALRAYRLRTVCPHVIVSHSIDADLVGQLMARVLRTPHVVLEHGGAGIPRSWHRRLLARVIAPGIRRVVVVSASQIPDLIRLDYRRERIVVIANGVSVPVPAHTREEVRRALDLKPDDVVATLVAGLRSEKRPDVFVEGVIRANRDNPRIRGLVVGDGALRESVEAQARAGRGCLELLGERADVADLMLASDVVCLSSDVEGLPLVVIEAMSLAKPVLSTSVGGLSDAVEHGVTGVLVPSGDVDAYAAALLEIADQPRRASHMGDAGKNRYTSRFTAEAMCDAYADMLEQLHGQQ